MIGKRELLAQLVVRSGLVGAVGKVHSLRHRDVKVLAYHRVLPRADEGSFPYDLELVSAWQDEFDWQMGYVAQRYEVITCRELARFEDTGKWPDKPCALVTFDDGYLDNHDVALPILRKHGIPAVIFVATGYMGASETFWYDKLAFDVLHARKSSLALSTGGQEIALGEGQAARRQATIQLQRHLKKVSNPERLETLARWHEALDVAIPPTGGLHRPMDWSHVRALSDAGIEIGSHTVSHPVLSRIVDVAELERELFDSKAAIEACTGQPVLSIAYPTGGRHAYNDTVVDCVKRGGYRFAFTYEGGVNKPTGWDPYRLARSAVERYVTRERFQAALANPGLFS